MRYDEPRPVWTSLTTTDYERGARARRSVHETSREPEKKKCLTVFRLQLYLTACKPENEESTVVT
jgi:hypothetical protein